MNTLSRHWLLLHSGIALVCAGESAYGQKKDPPPSPEERDFNVRVQVLLDRELSPPGRIDGRRGTFTYKGLMNLCAIRGWDAPGAEFAGMLQNTDPIYVTYAVPEEAKKWIGGVPGSKSAQAKNGRMPYTSLAEFVAERFHCHTELLNELNPEVAKKGVRVGDELLVPNVEPFQIETLVKELTTEPDFVRKLYRVEVRVADKLAWVFPDEDGARPVAIFPITPGGAGGKATFTPKGTWVVRNVVVFPTFRYDKSLLKQGKRSDNFHMIPPGPNNPVGVAWIGLNRSGIGLHGTNDPVSIGRAASHGCVRLANWDIVRLKPFVTVGTPVKIF